MQKKALHDHTGPVQTIHHHRDWQSKALLFQWNQSVTDTYNEHNKYSFSVPAAIMTINYSGSEPEIMVCGKAGNK